MIVNEKSKIKYVEAINDPPKDGDILEIVIELHEYCDILNEDNHTKNLSRLYNDIRQYIDFKASKNVGKLVAEAEHDFGNEALGLVTKYFPFRVIAPNNKSYPLRRRFQIRLTYKYTYLNDQHIPTLQLGEKETDFGTIFIDNKQKTFNKALQDAKEFIDEKIEEVERKYKEDPSHMSDI